VLALSPRELRALRGADALEHLETVQAGHLEVEEDQLRRGLGGAFAVEVFERLDTVTADMHVVGEVVLVESMERELNVILVVLNQENVNLLVRVRHRGPPE